MSDPHEPTHYSELPMSWQSEAPVLVSRWVQLQLSTEESWQRDTMELLHALPTAPTLHQRYANGRFMLRLTWSLTPHDMGLSWQAVKSMLLIPHAIRVHVYLLMLAYHPLFSLENIEMSPVSDCWQM